MTVVFIVGVSLLALLAILAPLSVRIVPAGHVGVVYTFGAFGGVLGPGLNFIIPLVMRVELFTTQVHQDEFPDEPEWIDRVNENPTDGKVKPFRIGQKGYQDATFYVKNTSGNISPDNPLSVFTAKRFLELPQDVQEAMKRDPFHSPLTSEIAVRVEWFLMEDEKSVRNFIENVQPDNDRDREEEVFKRMSDAIEQALQEILAKVTYGHLLENFELFSALIQLRLEHLVGEKGRSDRRWGIHINSVGVKSGSAGKRVNEARAAAAAAVSEAEAQVRKSEADLRTTKNNADGEAHQIRVTADANKHRREREAEAAAYEEKKKGEGEAERIKAMASVMRDENARFIAALDVAETGLSKGNHTYLPIDGVGELLRGLTGLTKRDEKTRIIP